MLQVTKAKQCVHLGILCRLVLSSYLDSPFDFITIHVPLWFLMIVTTKLEIYISNYSDVDYQYEVMGEKKKKKTRSAIRVPGWDFILATALRLEENLLTSLDSSYLFCGMEQ